MATTDKMLEVIKRIAQAKKEAKKACNQIAAYEICQQINKFTDELVSLYEESEHQSASQQQEPYDTILCPLCGEVFDITEYEIRRSLIGRKYIYCHGCGRRLGIKD